MAKAKKLPSGNWRVQASITVDGVSYRQSFTADTRGMAELQAKKWQVEIREKQCANNITLKQAFERYISAKENTLSPATVREYTRTANTKLSSIMNIKVSQLTREKIQVAINLEAATLSPKSVRNIHGLLSAVLKMFRPDLILNTHLPEKQDFEPFIPTESHLKELLADIKGTDLEKAVCLAAFGPMRRGEICALESTDISDCTIKVSKSVVMNKNKQWITKSPKTKTGNREIEYPQFVIDLFKDCDGKLINYNPNSLYNAFSKALKRNNIPHFRFHDLRHYSASILHALGYPDKYIMARGGWKSTNVLNRVYKHALKEQQKDFDSVAIKHFNKTFAHEISHEITQAP